VIVEDLPESELVDVPPLVDLNAISTNVFFVLQELVIDLGFIIQQGRHKLLLYFLDPEH